MVSRRKPYNDRAGYLASLRSGPEQLDGKCGWVVIYNTEAQGLDSDGGPWSVVCETHGTIVQVSSQRAARSVMKAGSNEFCDCCRQTCTEGFFDKNEKCPNCGYTRETHERCASMEAALDAIPSPQTTYRRRRYMPGCPIRCEAT